MRNSLTLALLGIALMACCNLAGAGFVPALWLGANFLALGIAHGIGAPRVFGKRPDGALSPVGWLLFMPLLAMTAVVWHLIRLLSREAAHNDVTESLAVGRRLLPSELPRDFDNYVDLTAEFAEPAAIRRRPGYFSFPILDGAAPTPEALRNAVGRLRPGTVFIHCAQGHGRTGLFALAVMLATGAASSVADGLQKLRSVRPGIHLNRDQQRCVERFAVEMSSEESSL